ncbi:hypothetical protein [Lederbergia lenta]|uniref:hypothetical protein n=1 Tax=Lederbergia lenta TaxID=1467 RepID=UPI00203C7F5B|nr:hypothetical protein [Lederbergia lenta]MCM3111691.1 hypothetical protein [Lederbergia lenta]
MNIQVNQITPRRENGEVVGLEVYFTGKNADQSINLNGFVPLKKGEFEEFLQFEEAENIVRQKVVERILNGESPVE